MNGLIIGSFGIYLLMVGFNGNSRTLLDYLQKDAPGFFPWAVVIAVLAVLNENENTSKIVKPFVGLAALTFVLQNFDKLKAEYDKIKEMAIGADAATANISDNANFGVINGLDWSSDLSPVDQIPKN